MSGHWSRARSLQQCRIRTSSRTGRSLSAWLGLVPRQNSSGGKERLGGITKAGDTYLRKMLFVGAMAVIRHAERFGTRKPG